MGLVDGEVVDVRENKAKPRQLGNTAVLQLSLTVPFDGLEWHDCREEMTIDGCEECVWGGYIAERVRLFVRSDARARVCS